MTSAVQFQREVEAPLGCLPSEQSRNGDTVLVTYKGFLADGKVFDSNQVQHATCHVSLAAWSMFDSNQGSDEPLTFTLGVGKVIKGWDRGLVQTCPGEQVQCLG